MWLAWGLEGKRVSSKGSSKRWRKKTAWLQALRNLSRGGTGAPQAFWGHSQGPLAPHSTWLPECLSAECFTKRRNLSLTVVEWGIWGGNKTHLAWSCGDKAQGWVRSYLFGVIPGWPSALPSPPCLGPLCPHVWYSPHLWATVPGPHSRALGQ